MFTKRKGQFQEDGEQLINETGKKKKKELLVGFIYLCIEITGLVAEHGII